MFKKTLFIFSLLSIPFLCPSGTPTQIKTEQTSKTEEQDAQTSTLEISPNENLIELNFQNASLGTILESLASQKGLILVPPSKEFTEKKISMTTKDPMNLDKAWDALLTLMEINGFRLVKSGKPETCRVVGIRDSSFEPMKVFSSLHQSWKELPDSGETVAYIYYMTNMKADQASNIIGAMTGEKPIIFADLDICIIKGASYRIKSAIEIIEPFDKEQLKQSMYTITLKHTAPEIVAKLITDEIMGNKGNEQQRIRFISSNKRDVSFLSSSVRIIPDQNHGTLILLGQDKQIKKIREFIEKFIDVDFGADKSRIKIKEINYRSAEDLQKTLTRLIQAANQGIPGRNMAFRDVKIVAESPSGSGGRGGGGGSGNGNRLIISCDPEDWGKINSLIENLDTLKPQIILEIMIVDASLSLTKALAGHIRDTGVGILGKNTGWAINNIGGSDNITEGWQSLGPAIDAARTSSSGDSMITFGNSNTGDGSDLWGLLRATFNETNSNIISQPFLVVNNGEKCDFSDSMTYRVAGELSSRGQMQVQKQENASASNNVSVVPRINSAGIVDMAINISVEEFILGENITSGTDKNTRNLDTKICMSVGEVLVLGGLSKKKNTLSKQYTPILGEIPLIGNLFKAKDTKSDDQTLFIFIRPSLIKPRNEVDADDYTQFKLDYAKLNIKRTDSNVTEKDPINKIFFKPQGMSVRQADQYSHSENYPPIDNFAQRQKLPLSTDIKNDVYYRTKNLVDGKQTKKTKTVMLEKKTVLKLKQRKLLDET